MKRIFLFSLFLFPLICNGQVIYLGCGSGGRILNSISVDLTNKIVTDWNGNKFKGDITDEKIEWVGEFQGRNYHTSINRYTGIKKSDSSNQQECKQIPNKKF
jgi:hypothetical protein